MRRQKRRPPLGVLLMHGKRCDEAFSVLCPLAEDILYQTLKMLGKTWVGPTSRMGDLEHAIEAVRSVAAQPAFCVGNFRLGLADEEKGDPAQVVAAFARALEMDHPSCKGLQDACAGRARALLRLGRADDRRNDLERCVQLDKSTPAGRECSVSLSRLE